MGDALRCGPAPAAFASHLVTGFPMKAGHKRFLMKTVAMGIGRFDFLFSAMDADGMRTPAAGKRAGVLRTGERSFGDTAAGGRICDERFGDTGADAESVVDANSDTAPLIN